MQPIISIQNVSKQYGDKTVLNNVNLDIYPGQIIGHIDPNGAGKSSSTIFKGSTSLHHFVSLYCST